MNWKQAFALGLCSVGAYAPLDERWETLFEGTVTTVECIDGVPEFGAEVYLGNNPNNNHLFSAGEAIRITVDGVSVVYTAVEGKWYLFDKGYYAGNNAVRGISSDYDDGYDFLVDTSLDNHGIYGSRFFSRNPGTYTVKIERKV